MVAAVKFHSYVERMAEGNVNLTSCKLALSNAAPDAATDAVIADVTEISAGNGYSAGGNAVTVTSSGQSGGTYDLVLTDEDPWLTASGGAIGPFRYGILTDASGDLVQYYDFGSNITLNTGDSLSLNWAAFTVRITS